MKRIIILLLVLIILSLVIRFVRSDRIYNPGCQLDMNGYCYIPNFLDQVKNTKLLNKIKNSNYKGIKELIISDPNIQNKIHKILNNKYVFQDYIWIIKKSNVHTCHRDNNGDFFNIGQKHPSYTLLIFLENMDRCLDVIPKSHRNKYNNSIAITDNTKSIMCQPGGALLFNANLIHTGSFNIHKPNNIRIQLKLTHIDDIDTLSYYQDFNKIVDKENKLPHWIKASQKHISCQFPILNDLTQHININSARGTSGGAKIGQGQKLFSYLFYGDKNYYDLKDI